MNAPVNLEPGRIDHIPERGEMVTPPKRVVQLPSMEDIERLASILQKSRIGPFANKEAAMVGVIGAFTRGQDLFAYAFTLDRNFHLIEGKLSRRVDVMLAAYRAHGGTFRIVEDTPDRIAIEFNNGDYNREFSMTWEEVQAEPWPWKGNPEKRELKKNYATPQARRDMIFARVASRGCRKTMPECNFGVYVPEELDGTNDNILFAPSKQAPKAASNGGNGNGDGNNSNGQASQPTPAQPQPITTNQGIELARLFKELNAPEEAINGILAQNNASHISELTQAAAGELIGKLQVRLSEKANEAALANESKQSQDPNQGEGSQVSTAEAAPVEIAAGNNGRQGEPIPPEPSLDIYGVSRCPTGEPEKTNGPAGNNTIKSIRSVVGELLRTIPDMEQKLAAMLQGGGFNQIADLTQHDAHDLYLKLHAKAFGEMTLPENGAANGTANANAPAQGELATEGK